MMMLPCFTTAYAAAFNPPFLPSSTQTLTWALLLFSSCERFLDRLGLGESGFWDKPGWDGLDEWMDERMNGVGVF